MIKDLLNSGIAYVWYKMHPECAPEHARYETVGESQTLQELGETMSWYNKRGVEWTVEYSINAKARDLHVDVELEEVMDWEELPSVKIWNVKITKTLNSKRYWRQRTIRVDLSESADVKEVVDAILETMETLNEEIVERYWNEVELEKME